MSRYTARTSLAALPQRWKETHSNFNAALRAAARSAKVYGRTVVATSKNTVLAHCSVSAKLGVGPKSQRDAIAFTNCELTPAGKKLLANKKKSKKR